MVYGRNAWLDSGYGVCDSTWLLDELHTFSASTWARILAFFLHSHAEWRSMLIRCFDLSPCTRCSPLEYGQYLYESMCWNLLDDEGHFSRSVRIFPMPPFGVESLVVLPINLDDLWLYTSHLRARVQNNNNNTIWRGSVLTGEEPPPHSGELKHALSQAGGPTQSQLSRPMSSGHHISMEHRQRRKQLNSY